MSTQVSSALPAGGNTDDRLSFFGDLAIPIKSYDVVPRPVRFRRAEAAQGTLQTSRPGNANILDVLDTSRPPAEPWYWFHPPADIGPFTWTRTKQFGRGLANFANICFLNATVQCLAYCTPFSQDCLAGQHAARCARRLRKEVCGFCYFERQIQALLNPAERSPASWPAPLLQLLKKEIRMNQGSWYGAQNCAHEWLVQFLDFLTKYDLPPELQKDFERGKLRSTELATCYLHQVFSGEFQEKKTCKQCGKASVRYDLNACIRVLVSPSKSLQEALRATFETEELTGSNRPMCENCGVPRDKTASRHIIHAPNVLVVLLQRAEFRPTVPGPKAGYHRYLPQVHKNSARMHIATQLDLSPFISSEARAGTRDGKSLMYDFLGSVNHAGCAGFGHYWAIVKGPDDMYHKVDDECHTMIPSSSLPEQLGSAYLVFYSRRHPPPPSLTGAVPLYGARSAAPVHPAEGKSHAEEAEPGRVRLCISLRPTAKPGCVSRPPASSATMTQWTDGTSPGAGQSGYQRVETAAATPTSDDDDDHPDLRYDASESSAFSDADVAASQRRLFADLTTPDAAPTRPPASSAAKRNGDHDHNSALDLLSLLLMRTAEKRARKEAQSARPLSRRLAKLIIFARGLRRRPRRFVSSSCPAPTRGSSTKFDAGEPVAAEQSTSDTASDDDGAIQLLAQPSSSNCGAFALPTAKTGTKMKPDSRIERAKSLTSQFGCTTPVDRWDEDDDEAETRAAFTEIQQQLAPKTTRRSRHDKQYDSGKTKKVKKTSEKEHRWKTQFNFKDRVIEAMRRRHRPSTGGRPSGHKPRQKGRGHYRKPRGA